MMPAIFEKAYQMRFKTRWMMREEFEALEKVVEYLADERQSYEGHIEDGQPVHKHIWPSIEILAAYVEEIYGSFQAVGSAIAGKRKRDRMEGRPDEGLPERMTISRQEPNRKRARPSLKVSFKQT
jgi:hypothetical protein